MRKKMLLSLCVLSQCVFALPTPHHPNKYVSAEMFDGGISGLSSELKGVRRGPHRSFERWVLDFSTQALPKFRIHYEKQPVPRLVISLQDVPSLAVKDTHLKRLAQRSPFVEKLIVYPAVENGDRVLEFRLKGPVEFAPFSPDKGPARLAIDLKRPHAAASK